MKGGDETEGFGVLLACHILVPFRKDPKDWFVFWIRETDCCAANQGLVICYTVSRTMLDNVRPDMYWEFYPEA